MDLAWEWSRRAQARVQCQERLGVEHVWGKKIKKIQTEGVL